MRRIAEQRDLPHRQALNLQLPETQQAVGDPFKTRLLKCQLVFSLLTHTRSPVRQIRRSKIKVCHGPVVAAQLTIRTD